MEASSVYSFMKWLFASILTFLLIATLGGIGIGIVIALACLYFFLMTSNM
jgi:hypothetical protein